MVKCLLTMNKRNSVLITYGLWLADILSICLSFILATFIRFRNFKDMADKDAYFIVSLVLVLWFTAYTFLIPWNREFLKRKIASELWQIIKMNAVIVLLTMTVMFFMKWADDFPRLVIVFFVILNVILTLLVHIAFRSALKIYYKSDKTRTKILVITQDNLADEVKANLEANLDISSQILDVVLTENINDEFYEKSMQRALDEVFIYAPDWSQTSVNEVMHFFDDMGVTCNYCVELPGMDSKRSGVRQFGNYSVIYYNHFQSSYKRLLIKRLMDIVGGLIGCVITIIVTPFVALAIKLDSKGPVFFKQTRIGRNGRRFKILKFRSMYIDAEERKKELEDQNQVKGLMFKMDDDPRITKVGKFIRKTSIDELPQFFNVVWGDMSLVGTRPPTEDEFEKYNQYYRRRISMTPGLTGLWQVSGRSNVDDFDDVVKYDLKYIDQWSLSLDVKILLKTIVVVFAGRGSK